MSDVVTVSVVSATSTVLVALISAPWLLRIKRDVRVTREQTENQHQASAYPNLRDQLDVIHALAEGAQAWAQAAATEARSTQRRLDEHEVDVADVIVWAREQMRFLESRTPDTPSPPRPALSPPDPRGRQEEAESD